MTVVSCWTVERVSILIGLLGVLLGGCQAGRAATTVAAPTDDSSPPDGAYFEFETLPGDRMIFKLTDADRIKEARDILSKNLQKHVTGTIVKAPRPYTKPWSFHLDPRSITFNIITEQTCDGAIRFVEEQLGSVGKTILLDFHWCPSSSRLTREVPPSTPR